MQQDRKNRKSRFSLVKTRDHAEDEEFLEEKWEPKVNSTVTDDDEKILMCISSTGGGHRSAAYAIKHAVNDLISEPGSVYHPVEMIISDVVEQSSFVHRFYVHLYNFLLRYRQSWMKYYHRIIEYAKPNDCELGYWLAAGYAKRLMETLQPCVVVSLHPMANHYLARVIAEANLKHKPRLIIVVTDPNDQSWTGWACKDADLTIVPNALARDRLTTLGIAPDRILTIGMPVDPSFLRPATRTRSSFLKELGLAPDLVTICLTAGWAGGGNTLQILDALHNTKGLFQAIVICGNNDSLFRRISDKSTQAPFPMRVVRRFPSMSDAMNASDLLITKAGGLTVFESIARGLPMAIDMITEPMPQEIGTAKILVAAGLAQPLRQATDICAIVEALTKEPHRERVRPPHMYNLDRTDAVYDIAKLILCRCDQHKLNNAECSYCMSLQDKQPLAR
jgi:UDP-N-acetylglucosamine:LPS N-acetylglucosamine transferase